MTKYKIKEEGDVENIIDSKIMGLLINDYSNRFKSYFCCLFSILFLFFSYQKVMSGSNNVIDEPKISNISEDRSSAGYHGFVAYHLHYDLDREFWTGTAETLLRYDWGETYIFSDLNFDTGNNLYGEYKQYFKIKSDIDLTIQYGGGQYDGSTFDHVVYAGLRIKSVDFLVRYDETNKFEFHFTYVPVFDLGKFSIRGFLDIWTLENDIYVLSEPGLWFNITKNFAIGGELEISYNFYEKDEFDFNPTVATKFMFSF